MTGISATPVAKVAAQDFPLLPDPPTALLQQGRYRARLALGQEDVDAAQALRHRCFYGAGRATPRQGGRDRDDLDAACLHLLVEDTGAEEAGGEVLAACCRLMPFADGRGAGQGYAARHYDLAGLAAYPAPLAEIGRFCVRPDLRDADVLRVAWGALAQFVDARGIAMLFGCTSFAGNDAGRYGDALALMRDRHLGPAAWRPGVGAAEVLRFADLPAGADPRRGLTQMPPLLRSYLAMGGWVGDHAVIDREMNTLHVFTGVEIAAIPPVRARALRALAGSAPALRRNGP